MKKDELLVDFDEMGFAPTTLCKNPEKYACEWKRQLLAEIERLKTQLTQANAGIVNCSGCRLVELNAVREFAEQVKMAFYVEFDELIPSIMADRIDELLKEYEK